MSKPDQPEIEPAPPFTERDLRRAKNEALFRHVNEKLEDLNETFATITDAFSVVCECDDAKCVEQMSVSRDTYEQVRARGDVFILRRGHSTPRVEVVIDAGPDWELVQKRPGGPAEFAEKTSPR